jgi:hypothetical protein
MINDNIRRLKAYYSFLKKSYRNQELEKLNASAELLEKYAQLRVSNQKEEFKAVEKRVHSQNGEDGILLFIFSKIGLTNRVTIEFGVGNGTQCNSANLLQNFGFTGLFMEGNQNDVKTGKRIYELKGITGLTFINAFITAENINDLITKAGFSGEIDLLNVDIDGNDYWVWKAINCVSPRVVVVEYNSSFGPEKAITVPYKPDFNRWDYHKSGWYHGASISALSKLAEEKGYDLVACDTSGVNAFFVRKDVNVFKKMSAQEAYYPEFKRLLKGGSFKDQLHALEGLSFVEV